MQIAADSHRSVMIESRSEALFVVRFAGDWSDLDMLTQIREAAGGP